MAQTPEQPTPLPKEKEARDRGLAIVATPLENEKVLFQKSPDGGMTIRFNGEVAIALSPKVSEASESVLTDTTGATYGLIPEGTPPPQSEPLSESGNGSNTSPEGLTVPESKNKKFEFVGNPVYDARYKERKSGKRIADFHIATHPEENETKYYRIRAFDDLAEKARDTIQKGQKDVEVVAYGPKYWRGKKKTENGWKEELIEGYYAGFVRVPKEKDPK